jgi:hypothetical protein
MLESDLYINRNFQPTKTTRAGTTTEVDDISGKYTDEEGVLHPAVIIFEEESPAAKGLRTKTGTNKNYFTAEELLPYQLKIAWYFCIELVRTPDEAERINRFYFRDCDETYVKLRHVPDAWVEGLPLGDMRPSSPSWRIAEMGRLFDEYGVQFFEPLEIWHIPALREEFVRRTGREPEGPSLYTRVRRAVRMQRKRFDRWVVDMARALRNQPY